MDDREFERLMEPLMAKIAEERIVPQNHKFSPDFEQKMLQKAIQEKKKEHIEESVCEKTVPHEIQHQKHDARIKKSDPMVSKQYAFGGIAACILLMMALGTMFHYRNEPELLQSTAVPMEEVQSSVQTTSTVTTTATTLAEERKAQMVTTVATTTYAANESELSTADTMPVPQMTETTVQTTEITTPTLVYELGDVDMDGNITLVDALLVCIDMQLAERGLSAQSLITDEQRALGNVNGQSRGRYWDGVSYVPEWRSDLNDFGQQIKYEPYLLDEGDFIIIKCIVICQFLNNDPITIHDYTITYGNYSASLLLDQMKQENPEAYHKYQSAYKIAMKYLQIESIDCFGAENDNNSSCYSLEEFWADMEILREMYC